MKIDLRWKVPKSNQLWLKWDKVEKQGNGLVNLINPVFYGDVLSDCDPIEKSGFINIDLTKHFIIQIPGPYIIKLSWDNLTSQDGSKATFDKMTIEDSLLGQLDNKLSDRDLLLLDATGHRTEEEAKGRYKHSFQGMLYNDAMEAYDFSK